MTTLYVMLIVMGGMFAYFIGQIVGLLERISKQLQKDTDDIIREIQKK